MAKMHLFKLVRDMQFGQELLVAGTTIGALHMESNCVDLSQLISMVQYSQVAVESIEVEEAESIHDEPEADANADDTGEFESESDQEQLQSSKAVPETIKPENDLASLGLDEVLIESLVANAITTKAELFSFVESGKNLVDLEKIGPTRAKKILAAIASHD